MGDDQIDNYVLECSNVLWSDLDKKYKDNILSVLTVNARNISGECADLITNLNLVRKQFNFIPIMEYG